MTPRQQNLLNLLLAVVALGLLSFTDWENWFNDDAQNETHEVLPDLVAYTVEQLSFNKEGQKHILLKAEQVQQYLETDSNRIIKPDVVLFRDQQPAWKTLADEGTSDNRGEAIFLSGNVFVEQQNNPRPATMETQTLTLSATQSRATTEDRVVIRQPGVFIEGTGLEADLNTNQLILKHQVTSIYEPEKT